jgi:iron-sulfur cluster repair protein YtfE (RIC family)
MTIIERFLEDHTAFRKHLADTLALARDLPEQAPPPAINDNDRAFTHRLRRHARMESELLFPAMQRAGSDDVRRQTVQQYIQHGNDEHHSVAKRQAELNSISSGGLAAPWRL